MKINLIQHPQKVKRTVYKVLNIFALVAIVLNLTMVSFMIKPAEAFACTGTISGIKYWDTNSNQIKDTNEQVLENWEITLYKKSGSNWVEQTTTLTNSQGQYSFNLGQYGHGIYKVEETQQTGWTNTTPLYQEVDFSRDGNFTVNFGNNLLAYCGDGKLDAGEQCDDGNNFDGDGCSAKCTVEPYCGDGKLDAGEQCDDGNNIDNDSCSNLCTTNSCDLEITKSVDKTTANPGDTLNYTINYINNGNGVCTGGGVQVFDHLDDYLTYVQDSRNIVISNNGDSDGYHGGDNYNGENETMLYNVERVSPGESGVITFQANITDDLSCGDYTIPNKAKIWSDQTSYIWSNLIEIDLSIPCEGDIVVNKEVDLDGDGIFDVGNVEANQMGFVWGIDSETPARTMGSRLTTTEGIHQVSENNIDNYHFVGWYTNGKDHKFSCEHPTTLPVSVNVISNSCYASEITLCNARDTGDVTFDKIVVGGSAEDSDFTFTTNDKNYKDGDSDSFITGSYDVTETGPDNYGLTDASGICSLVNGKIVMGVTTEGGTCVITNTFENYNISGSKWNDMNGDGEWQNTELGMPWEINLYQNDQLIDTQTGNQNGWYQFTVPAGTYKVCEAMNASWLQTYPATEDGCHMVNVPADLPGNDYNKGFHFGNYEYGKISGYKFEDINNNGAWDGEEVGLAGWEINLWNEVNGQPGVIVSSAITNEFGMYEFDGLMAGNYYLSETMQEGWYQYSPIGNVVGPINVTSGYDNGSEENYFLFGNAEKITLTLDKYNNQEVAQGGDGLLETSETVNYHIDWGVAGNSIATNVVLTDIIPTELNLDVASISDAGVWNSDTRTITWDFGDQQPNASGFVTYSAALALPVTVTTGFEIINTARISADNSDPLFVEDNSKVTVELPIVEGEVLPKLVLTKSVDKTFINPGGNATYTLKVENIGEGDAINVKLQDLLPAGFNYEDGSVTKTWNLGDILAGSSIEVSYVAYANDSILPGNYDNLAVVWADNHGNVTDDATIEVRDVVVKGEELPTTGGGILNWIYLVAAILILVFSAYMLRLTFNRER